MDKSLTDKSPMNKRRFLRWSGAWALGVGVVLCGVGLIPALWDAAKWLFPMGGSCLLAGVVWLLLAPWVSDEPMRPELVRLFRAFFPAMVAYFLVMPVTVLIERHGLPTWATAMVALLPVLPMAWLVISIWQYVRDSEELEQRIQLEAIAITCGIVCVVTFAAGMLQMVHVLPLRDDLIWVQPLIFLVYGVASWLCRRRYGLEGIC